MEYQPLRIVIGYDGSRDAALALNWAVEAANRLELPVVAVVAGPGHEGPVPEGDWDSTRLEEIRAAAEWALSDAAAVDGSAVVRRGPVAQTLLEAAEGAALLVVGSRGHGPLNSLVMGSVSQAVARRAGCPVVVVRPSETPAPSRIVVGVDGSLGCRAALEFACSRAELTGEPVVALYARKLPKFFVDAQGRVPPVLVARLDDEERLAQEAADDLRKKYPDVDLRSHTVKVAAAQGLVDASLTASLVVVGSRGQGAVPGMLLGSVSQAVLHRALCPVAVAR